MLASLTSIAASATRIADGEAKRVYKRLVLMLFGIIGLSLIMWMFNIVGAKEVNIVFFILGGAVLLIMGFVPRLIVGSAIAGTLVEGLMDRDLSQGAVKGVRVLYKVVFGLLFGFFILAGLLATWSFQNAPFAFWVVVAGMMMLTAMGVVFNLKGNKMVTVTIVTVYALFIIVGSFWQTLDGDTKDSLRSIIPTPAATISTRWEELVDGKTYTVTEDEWLVFTRPEGKCPGVTPPTALTAKYPGNEYWIRSQSGERTITAHILEIGEEWHGETCTE